MSGISSTPTPFLVHCANDGMGCGKSSYLTLEEYDKQLLQPNKGWRCPNCGVYPCDWDDANYEKRIKEFKLT